MTVVRRGSVLDGVRMEKDMIVSSSVVHLLVVCMAAAVIVGLRMQGRITFRMHMEGCSSSSEDDDVHMQLLLSMKKYCGPIYTRASRY